MLRTTKLDGQGRDIKTGAPVLEYLKATEYYLDRDGNALSSSQWLGGGARALGLDGEVNIEVMEKLARGIAPDGTDLRQNAGDATRVGWDLTFSTVKTVSFAYSIADPAERDNLLDTQNEAVDAAMSYMQDLSRVRTGKAGLGEQLQTTGLVASRHNHFGSRELEPQLHSHVLSFNAAQGVDGKWRALHADHMLQHTMAAGALYRAEQAWQLRQRGYGIVKERDLDADGRETGKDSYKLAGIDERLIDRISTRRNQILEYQKEHGGTMDQASLATRKHKDEPTYSELVKMWHQSLEEAQKQDPSLKVPTIEELQSKACVFGEEITDDDILKRLHKTESSFTRAQLVERMALEHVGQKDAKGVLQEVDAFLKRANIVELTHHNDHKLMDGEPKYAAQWMIDMEQEIGARGRARMDEVQVKVAPETAEEAIAEIEAKKNFKFSQEQIDAVAHLTVDTGGTAIISGRAGTGKTTLAEAAVLAWRKNGQEVIGVSTGWDAAKKLEAEAKIESFSAAKLLWDLDNGNTTLTNRHVLLFDEAGMAGTEVIHRLQTYTDAASCKLVLQGDKHQLAPVSAGSPFSMLIDEIGHKEITDVRRQRTQAGRDMTNLLYQDSSRALGQEIMARHDAQGQVYRFDTYMEKINGLADKWVASPQQPKEKMIIGGTNVDVGLTNEAIRERLQAAGEVGEDKIRFKAIVNKEWKELAVADGDRLRFGKLNKDMDVVNGTIGIVQAITKGKNDDSHQITVKIESDIPSQDGRVVAFDTADYKSISYGWAGTVHKSQGQGKEEVYMLANAKMADKNLHLVATTRAMQKFEIFGTHDDIAEMTPKIGVARPKLNAIDQMKKVEPPTIQIDDKTKEQARSFGALIEEQRKLKKGRGMGMRR
jgi:conjugative relaxase-like TrwC/TraI family protein